MVNASNRMPACAIPIFRGRFVTWARVGESPATAYPTAWIVPAAAKASAAGRTVVPAFPAITEPIANTHTAEPALAISLPMTMSAVATEIVWETIVVSATPNGAELCAKHMNGIAGNMDPIFHLYVPGMASVRWPKFVSVTKAGRGRYASSKYPSMRGGNVLILSTMIQASVPVAETVKMIICVSAKRGIRENFASLFHRAMALMHLTLIPVRETAIVYFLIHACVMQAMMETCARVPACDPF